MRSQRHYREVSIHASAREATSTCTLRTRTFRFQSTPPHGRRPGDALSRVEGGHVSIHASAREATTDGAQLTEIAQEFQSTPPHGRRPGKSGTTYFASLCFNPRLRTGGDTISRLSSNHLPSFNPRLRTGGDVVQEIAGHADIVSIHASAREATHWERWAPMAPFMFQSTPPHGRRLQRSPSLSRS